MLFAGMWYAVSVKSITLGPASFDALCMYIKLVSILCLYLQVYYVIGNFSGSEHR